jgi:hypothetical protein
MLPTCCPLLMRKLLRPRRIGRLVAVAHPLSVLICGKFRCFANLGFSIYAANSEASASDCIVLQP